MTSKNTFRADLSPRRTNAIAFHPTNGDIFYVGAPAGGLWITTNGGQSWTTHTDQLPTLGVSAIIVDYDNPLNIFIGTGDRDAGDAAGMGVMKSEDGGVTFTLSNFGMGEETVGMMLQHPEAHKFDASSINKCTVGSAILPGETKRHLETFFPNISGIYDIYGCTEAEPSMWPASRKRACTPGAT